MAWWPGISLKCSARIVTNSCYVPVSLWWQHEECLVLFSLLLLSIICGERERERSDTLLSTSNPPHNSNTPFPSHSSFFSPLFATFFFHLHVLLNYLYCFSHSPHFIPVDPSLWSMRGQKRSCSSIHKHLLHESSPTPPQINSLLKGGCNLSPVNVLGVESILPGFSNFKEKNPLMSKHLIKAWVSLDHIVERSTGRRIKQFNYFSPPPHFSVVKANI